MSVEIGIYHAVLGFLYLTIVCSTTVAVLLFRRVPHIWKLPTCVINTVAVGAIVFSFGRTVVFWLLAWIFVVVALWAGQRAQRQPMLDATRQIRIAIEGNG